MIDQEQLEQLYQNNVARKLDNVAEVFHLRLRDKLIEQGFEGLKLTFASVMSNMDFTGTRLVDIAEITGMTKQAIGQIASEIEELGYIQRIPDPHDGRAKNLIFTPKGEQLIKASLDAVDETETEFAQLIGAEKMGQLDALLRELSHKLGK